MLTINLEPELDSYYGKTALSKLQQADFVVSLTAYRTSTIESYADVMLPIALFTETSGTYINIVGNWQRFTGVVQPAGDIRPGTGHSHWYKH